MTVANPVPGHYGADQGDDMLEQQKTDLLLKNEFALAIVDSRQRRYCIQKLAGSTQPGTEWAL